jgi:hypothetical protein
MQQKMATNQESRKLQISRTDSEVDKIAKIENILSSFCDQYTLRYAI